LQILSKQKILKSLENKYAQFCLWLGFAAFFLGSFVIVTTEIQEASSGETEFITTLDKFPLSTLERIRNPQLNAIAVDLTALGSVTVVSVFLLISSILLLIKKKYKIAIHLAASGMGAAFLTWALKSFFERPRPNGLHHLVEVQGYSYPSGHSVAAAAVYFTFAILLCSLFHKWTERITIVGIALFFIFLVGLSCVYLGVHYVSDILAGILIGIAWASLLGAVSTLKFHPNDVLIKTNRRTNDKS
jgi:undecaprenyl-diphosphatase